MTTSSLKSLEATLRARQQELTARLAAVQKTITASHSADWSEQAQERQNDEVTEAIGNETRAELSQVNRALARVESGDYCYCHRCGAEIPLARLAAVPFTDLCINCASR